MKIRNRSTKATLLAAFLISAVSLAQAAVISVNFGGTQQGALYQYTVAGSAGVVNVGNWNNYYDAGGIGGDGVHNGLLNSDGTATGTYINYTAGTDLSVWGLGQLGASITNPNIGLMNDYLNYFSTSQKGSIIYFGGLGSEFTSAGYSVIVYFTNPYSTQVSLTLTEAASTTYYANVDSTVPFAGFVGSSATTLAAVQAPGTPSANYVQFNGLTSSFFNITGDPAGSAYPAIAGIQIIAVPEPSTYALVIIAIGGMVIFRRRSGLALQA